MTLEDLYKSQGCIGSSCARAQAVLEQTHWFTVNAHFDPKTGEALPQALSSFLARLAQKTHSRPLRDRLWRITEHARPSVERLLRSLNESPRREHALLPVRAVRELDANSFMKLSNRPGRNIREKLAGKPYLQAVRRFQSVDLPENRLLKAFISRLADLLELRRECLEETNDEILPRIQAWLLSGEAKAIARWDNLPPNNTLLAHRDYRRVWDAWRWLQTLDDDIGRDMARLDTRAETMRVWNDYARTYAEGSSIFAEMPVLFDYEEFAIRHWTPQPVLKSLRRRVGRRSPTKQVSERCCIDLTNMYPQFATTVTPARSLSEKFLWQQWMNDVDTVDIELFDSDAVYLHPDATSISSEELLFSKNHAPEHLDRAARAFASKLRDIFTNDTLIWLVPDVVNDFDLEITRRNVNARFPDAEPLPRSVAAVFEQVDYSRITNDGFPLVVVDNVGGATCATKLIARFDPELDERLPETRGFYFERCPPVIISHRDSESAENTDCKNYEIASVDLQGHWRDETRPKKSQYVEMETLKRDPRIGQFAFCINLDESPVQGGIYLHGLQERAGDIPLWRDQIPELSMKVMKEGRYQRFDIVPRGTTIKPVRGLSVQIPIVERFTLPAGRRFYQFPLYQGENAAELRFSARLDSPAFPLKVNTECDLILTFQYGEDEPYTLVFAPLDKSFPPIRATWQRTVEEVITDARAPEYPPQLSWEDLHQWRDPQGNEVDLLAWLNDSLKRLIELTPRRLKMSISSSWKSKIDNNGSEYWFTFATTEDGQNCYCNSKRFVSPTCEDPNEEFSRGTELYGNIMQTRGGIEALDISRERGLDYSLDTKRRIMSFRERSLQNRMSTIWADGRSVTDASCPTAFSSEFESLIIALLENLPPDIVDRKMMFLLACLHKDTVDNCVKWVTDQVEGGNIRDPRAIGFALGDVSREWQQYVYDRLASQSLNENTITVFAYAIWRERHFVERFSLSNLKSLLTAVLRRLRQIQPLRLQNTRKIDKWERRNWARATAEPLELLLGLLRTRASDDPDIRILLQPHQKMTKQLAEQIDRVEEVIAGSHVTLFSRVQISVQKPEGVRTPDLLYALRLYLTGDAGADAIHITSVSDNDEN